MSEPLDIKSILNENVSVKKEMSDIEIVSHEAADFPNFTQLRETKVERDNSIDLNDSISIENYEIPCKKIKRDRDGVSAISIGVKKETTELSLSEDGDSIKTPIKEEIIDQFSNEAVSAEDRVIGDKSISSEEKSCMNGESSSKSDDKKTVGDEVSDDVLKDTFRYYSNGETSCPRGKLDDLRVFQVLDECVSSEDDENTGDDTASDISYEEIEAMLEEGLNNSGSKDKPAYKDSNGIRYTEHATLVLEELGHNHFDMLPEGWIQVTHKSGMPVYLHKGSRVCTLSRPYYLGQGSVRKHNVPLNAVPCLQYRRALEEEEVKRQEMKEVSDSLTEGQYLHTAKIETTEENKLSQSVNPFTLQQYCKKLFRFKREQRLHFVSWADRRKYAKQKKNDKEHHRPSFPDGTKLIKFPIQNPDDGPKAKPRGEWIMNPNGKSYICILHEYVQHALKKQPTYEFKALENPSTPYSATVIINHLRYGYGTGTSKKQAKLAAAKASLEILIPEMREKIRSDSKSGKRNGTTNFPDEEETSLSIFDEIRIEDPRVAEFCAKTTEPSPYSILLTCLQRNFGLKDMPINYKVNPLHRQSNEFIMTVGKHTAKVICKNKKEGKQRASQAILQDLHPHISNWGALLRLYGNRSVRNVKEKKQEEQEITMLQSKASLNSPNYSIINKLRSEMKKLHDQQMQIKPIGVFIPPEEIELPSSGTELDKVDF